MSENPVISLVIPVYGVEKYIAEFARSVFSQSYTYVQYVFVNDGTKDNSISVLRQLIDDEFPHLNDRVIIVDKENGGLPAARKTGLQYATGDYIYHVDPDDWLSEGSLEAIAACARETNADVVYFNYAKEYADRTSVKRERVYTLETREKYIRNMYNHRAFGTLCNKCVKRSVYIDNQLHHPRYGHAEDCILSVQLVGYAQSFAHLDMTVYHYRKTNPAAMTRNGLKRRKGEYAANFLDLYEAYKDSTHPLRIIFDDVFLQAGWYSMIYGLGLFKSRPYLAGKIRQAKVRGNSNTWIPLQLFVKICSYFRKK